MREDVVTPVLALALPRYRIDVLHGELLGKLLGRKAWLAFASVEVHEGRDLLPAGSLLPRCRRLRLSACLSALDSALRASLEVSLARPDCLVPIWLRALRPGLVDVNVQIRKEEDFAAAADEDRGDALRCLLLASCVYASAHDSKLAFGDEGEGLADDR